MTVVVTLFIFILGLATENYVLAVLAIVVGIIAHLCKLWDEGRLGL